MDRRVAVAAYKERKTVAGIYAVRCSVASRLWVGSAPDIHKIFNRLEFALRNGGWSRADLQEVWAIHGPDVFAFETLERLPEAPSAYVRDASLKERREYWREKLGAMLA